MELNLLKVIRIPSSVWFSPEKIGSKLTLRLSCCYEYLCLTFLSYLSSFLWVILNILYINIKYIYIHIYIFCIANIYILIYTQIYIYIYIYIHITYIHIYRNVKYIVFIYFAFLIIKWIMKYKQVETRIMVHYLIFDYHILYINIHIYLYIYIYISMYGSLLTTYIYMVLA